MKGKSWRNEIGKRKSGKHVQYEGAKQTFREMEQERRSGKSVMNKKEQKLKKEEERQRGENYKKGHEW